MLALILLAVTSTLATAQTCPQQYSRFSTQHSFCLPSNKSCEIVHSGVKNNERKVILKVHNNYRSKVATGQEPEAGGLPSASDMMQMDWDVELESVAQKWAAQCIFKHDCGDCRAVENFRVGQNLAYEDVPACSDKACLEKAKKPNWEKMIGMFYDEVKLFKNQLVKNFQSDDRYGHFTQVAWAKTWKVGCGYVVFKNGNWLRKLYACNYGPAGNYLNEEMYKAGKPCSQCPSNTCCGSCKSSSYPGLCKVMNMKKGPLYESSRENSLIDCNWKKGKPTCNFKVDGQPNWSLKPALGGYYYTVLLKGGEKTSLKLMTPITPKSNAFCLVVVFRKSPADASQRDSSDFKLDLNMDRAGSSQMTLQSSSTSFTPYSITLSWGMKTKVVFNFSVPPNAPDHIIDIKEVFAYDGRCTKN